jgi:hypothetical protein
MYRLAHFRDEVDKERREHQRINNEIVLQNVKVPPIVPRLRNAGDEFHSPVAG